MSKGQRGNKEAKKPKKAATPGMPAAPGLAAPLPVGAQTVAAPRDKKR